MFQPSTGEPSSFLRPLTGELSSILRIIGQVRLLDGFGGLPGDLNVGPRFVGDPVGPSQSQKQRQSYPYRRECTLVSIAFENAK